MVPDRQTASLAALSALVVVVALVHSPDQVLNAAEAAASDPATFAVVLVVLYAVRPALLWPTTLLAVVVGYGAGIAVGIPVALVGAAATSVLPFLVARRLGRDAPTIARLQRAGERWFDTTGDFRGVVAARLAPVPADAVTCAVAVSGVRLRTFLAGVLVGELPWTVAGVVVGASLSTLDASGIGAVGTPLAVATGAAALVLLAGPLYSLVRSSDRTTPSGQ